MEVRRRRSASRVVASGARRPARAAPRDSAAAASDAGKPRISKSKRKRLAAARRRKRELRNANVHCRNRRERTRERTYLLYSLPDIALENVLSFLTAPELARSMCTADFMRDAAGSSKLWQAHLQRDFRQTHQEPRQRYGERVVDYKRRIATVAQVEREATVLAAHARSYALGSRVSWLFLALPATLLPTITDAEAHVLKHLTRAVVASLILLLAWVFSSATAIVIACVRAYCGYWWSYTVHTLPLLALAATLFRVVVGPPLDHVVDQVPWLRLDDTRLWRVLCGVSAAAVPLFAVLVRVPPVLLALLAAAKILIPFLRWLCYALAFVIIPGSLLGSSHNYPRWCKPAFIVTALSLTLGCEAVAVWNFGFAPVLFWLMVAFAIRSFLLVFVAVVGERLVTTGWKRLMYGVPLDSEPCFMMVGLMFGTLMFEGAIMGWILEQPTLWSIWFGGCARAALHIVNVSLGVASGVFYPYAMCVAAWFVPLPGRTFSHYNVVSVVGVGITVANVAAMLLSSWLRVDTAELLSLRPAG